MAQIKWDLQALIERQKQLDNYINDAKKTSYKKTFYERLLALGVELNELANTTKCFKYWSSNKKINFEDVLEEYVDGLHFSLSLLIYYDLPIIYETEEVLKLNDAELTLAFWELNQTLVEVKNSKTFPSWFLKFLKLSSQLGFSQAQVYSLYYRKSQVNFDRQNSGY